MAIIHALELKEHRVKRLGGNPSSQALCSNGSAHVTLTSNTRQVTCAKCIELLKDYPSACEVA
jgi:hypothetical protein